MCKRWMASRVGWARKGWMRKGHNGELVSVGESVVTMGERSERTTHRLLRTTRDHPTPPRGDRPMQFIISSPLNRTAVIIVELSANIQKTSISHILTHPEMSYLSNSIWICLIQSNRYMLGWRFFLNIYKTVLIRKCQKRWLSIKIDRHCCSKTFLHSWNVIWWGWEMKLIKVQRAPYTHCSSGN